MVQWKGKLEGEVGSKAENLEQLEDFNVPNFFVITSNEVKRLFKGAETAEEALNTELEPGKREEVKNAFKEVGMSSEVRTAAGKAKSLVGGQRNGQHVSVRVSDHGNGMYDYELDVGSSNLFDAIKKVAASYYRENNGEPSIIVQKMIEPEYTGAVVPDYSEDHGIIEAVEGLGHTIEDGITRPYLYFFREGGLEKVGTPDKQLKVTRNPMNGGTKRREISGPEKPFSEHEAEDFFQKISRQGLNVKFAYKRGSFHIVDAWKQDAGLEEFDDMEGLKVSEGSISGTVGRDVVYSDDTLPPEKYGNAVISRKGCYTSTDAQKAREHGKTAVFSFEGDLERGENVDYGVENGTGLKHPFQDSQQGRKNSIETETLAGSEVLALNPSRGKGVYTSPPFGPGYRVSRGEKGIPEEAYLASCADVFGFEGEKAVLDLRSIEEKAVRPVLEYLEADLKILVLEEADRETVLKALGEGFEVFAAEKRYLGDLERRVAEMEKKFILDRLRDGSN